MQKEKEKTMLKKKTRMQLKWLLQFVPASAAQLKGDSKRRSTVCANAISPSTIIVLGPLSTKQRQSFILTPISVVYT